ncbi:MAG: dTDP-4-amino-4,6-dideoxyglucose formyltransferase [Bacteroidales bacterium]|nr:dTDP-4-amino-4,6-dideoxyglucose formyltransferase [Bacteroidales bacterium]MDD2636672.1 dTDP-4-amino-4,6-dideoxyglucose formyltransferase [Bacteroidales bacterium]MDD4210300.1 dTDP-4-amino-4,6-dideoxyglucose formyltransferase [Bacteroidales bacterium]
MFKNILVVTDNLYMCTNFQQVFEDLSFKGVRISFAISPFSDKNNFENRLKFSVSVYDLKNDKHVKTICENYDLVFSIHCKQIFPKELVNTVKCINVHPGYNPINRGWYPQVFSILYDIPIGATIHEIDEKLDHGNIIDREFVEKEIVDTSLTLYNKVLKKEIFLLKKNLPSIISNCYSTIKPENEGKLFMKNDFKNLCEIDLKQLTTAEDLINKFRALTHNDYKNAFFIDQKTNKKVFISINLEYGE